MSADPNSFSNSTLQRIRDLMRPDFATAIATAVKKAAAPAIVTALPSAPTDGQVIYYQSAAMATVGIVWALRYRTASSSAYKWECVGAGLWDVESNGSIASSLTGAWQNTVNPNIVLPLAGDYEVSVSCLIGQGAVANGNVAVAPSKSASVQSYAEKAFIANETASMYALEVWRACSAGDTFSVWQFTADPTPSDTFSTNRRIYVRPIRVG